MNKIINRNDQWYCENCEAQIGIFKIDKHAGETLCTSDVDFNIKDFYKPHTEMLCYVCKKPLLAKEDKTNLRYKFVPYQNNEAIIGYIMIKIQDPIKKAPVCRFC